MSRQRHPDAEALARYQAGDVDGFRGRRLAAHVADCARCASVTDDLAAVSTLLASVPAPSMPDAVERADNGRPRRRGGHPPGSQPGASPGAAADSVRASLRPVRSDRSHTRGFRAGHGGCLGGGMPAAGRLRVPAKPDGEQFELFRDERGRPRGECPRSGCGERPRGCQRRSAARGKAVSPTRNALKPLEGQQAVPFLVTKSGTSYQQATLAAQVRGELNRRGTPSASAGTPPATGSQSAGSAGGLPPSPSLIGCVLTRDRERAAQPRGPGHLRGQIRLRDRGVRPGVGGRSRLQRQQS